jgi:hypothetical protein
MSLLPMKLAVLLGELEAGIKLYGRILEQFLTP